MDISCPEDCGYSVPSSHLRNLRRHLTSRHAYDEERMLAFDNTRKEERRGLTCEQCDMKFANSSNLNRHIKSIHQPDTARNEGGGGEEEEEEEEEEEREEGEEREQAADLNEEDNKEFQRKGVTCPIDGCEGTGKSRTYLTGHCAVAHADQSDTEKYSIHFASVDCLSSFEDQKERIEEGTVTNFTLETTYRTDKQVTYYYYCSRANRIRCRGKNSRAEWRHVVQRHCSAFLTAKENLETGEVTYEYSTGHIGHSLDPGQLRMSGRLTREIKHYILQDLSTQWILKEIKATGKMNSRRRWVDEKDVENIRTRIGAQPWRRAKDEIQSVQLLGIEHPEWGIRIHEDPLRISIITDRMKEWINEHSHRGLCMDDTFHSTKYNFKLLIVSVLDDVDRCLPVAYLFSNSMTAADVGVLLKRVRDEVGVITPSVLMTDDTMVFWNGLISIFPNCEHNTQKLLCMFHVLQSVKRQAPQKVIDKEKVKRIVASFRALTKEPSAPRFIGSLMNLLEWLKKEKELDFLSYLRTHYLGAERIKQWAPYFRQGSALNVNMGLERINEQLKNGNLKRRAGNSRLDHSLFQCVQLSLQIEERHLTADMRCKVGGRRRLQMTHSRHQSALEDYSEVGTVQCSPNVWRVNSKSDSNRKYRVERKRDCPCKSSINNHCTRCRACPYVWQCSCPDSTKSGVCCVHVHAVIIYTNVNREQEDELQAATDSIEIIPEDENEDPPLTEASSNPNAFSEMRREGEEREEMEGGDMAADDSGMFQLVTVPEADTQATDAIDKEDRARERRTRLDQIQSIQLRTLQRLTKDGNEEEADLLISRLEELTAEFSTIGWNEPVPREPTRLGRPSNAQPIRKYTLVPRATTKREQRRNILPPEPIKFNRFGEGSICSICKEDCPLTASAKRKKPTDDEEADASMHPMIWCLNCKNWAHRTCVLSAKGSLERCVHCNLKY